MLSGVHFYHRITRKMVVAFGTLFNNITLKRYNKAGTQEIERINVPLMYAQKEKFYERITQDPNLANETMMTLPRMSFEMTAITYDPLRKRSSFVNSFSAGSDNTKVKNVVATPYNFEFTLTIYVRNVEDGTQIIEQILPYFSPDYTVTMNLVDVASEKTDVPFILNSVSQEVNNVGVSSGDVRIIMWTLSFTAKGYMYGATSESKIIRKAIANTYDSTFNTTAQREITFSTGRGVFKVGELVYEGRTLSEANATAFVHTWNPTTNTIVVVDTNGVLNTGRYMTGAVSNASWNIQTFATPTNQLVRQIIYPNPLNANADTAFGFTEVLQEAPYFFDDRVDSTLIRVDIGSKTADDNT
jgi:hypothetical protein